MIRWHLICLFAIVLGLWTRGQEPARDQLNNIAIIGDSSKPFHERLAAAQALASLPEQDQDVLKALADNMDQVALPPSIDDWEESSDPKVRYPVWKLMLSKSGSGRVFVDAALRAGPDSPRSALGVFGIIEQKRLYNLDATILLQDAMNAAPADEGLRNKADKLISELAATPSVQGARPPQETPFPTRDPTGNAKAVEPRNAIDSSIKSLPPAYSHSSGIARDTFPTEQEKSIWSFSRLGPWLFVACLLLVVVGMARKFRS